MVSFLVDQLPLCSSEGAAWIAMQIIDMMLHKPDIQASAQVLKPLVLHFASTYNTLAAHVVFLLEVSCELFYVFRLCTWHAISEWTIRSRHGVKIMLVLARMYQSFWFFLCYSSAHILKYKSLEIIFWV